MLTNRLPLDLAELVLRFLPPLPKVGPKGGRPPIDHVTALKVPFDAEGRSAGEGDV